MGLQGVGQDWATFTFHNSLSLVVFLCPFYRGQREDQRWGRLLRVAQHPLRKLQTRNLSPESEFWCCSSPCLLTLWERDPIVFSQFYINVYQEKNFFTYPLFKKLFIFCRPWNMPVATFSHFWILNFCKDFFLKKHITF